MKEYAAMNITINDYDAAKEKLWAKSFIPALRNKLEGGAPMRGKCITTQRNEEVYR